MLLNDHEHGGGFNPTRVSERTEDSVVSLQVDSIDEIVTVNEASFERAPDTLDRNVRQLITGAYKLDTTLLLCLDVDKVVGLVHEKKDSSFGMPDQG